MQRFADWPARLDSFLQSRRATAFTYGAHDCCLFVADAIVVMTGIDFAAEFRNRYRTRFGALRRLREKCAGGTVDAIAGQVFAAHGVAEIRPGYAQRGDVVAIRQRDDMVLGLIMLNGWPVVADDPGWAMSSRAHAVRAWKV